MVYTMEGDRGGAQENTDGRSMGGAGYKEVGVR